MTTQCAVVPVTRDVPRAPLEVQYRRIHGYRRAFVHTGSGPTVLLIHGIGDSLDTWGEVIPALAKHYTVIAPDLLGHGRSEKPRADYSVAGYANAMRDLLSVLDVECATVVGHSLGGGVAMQFAYQYPERCERLVLVSSGGVSRDVHPVLRLAATPLGRPLVSVLGLPFARTFGRGIATLLKALNTDLGRDEQHWMRVFDRMADASARRAFVSTVRAVVDVRGQVITMLDRCYLARGMPTLILWGTRDGVIPFEHAQLIHAAMPGSRLHPFDGAGHFPHHSNRTAFLAALDSFIRNTPPAAYSVRDWRELLRRGRPGRDENRQGELTNSALDRSLPSGT
ncbi:MAG TPA: alpha/beta fold hydrolase [Polyangiaceae bacterium]|nr:alpha/beta fold hydrolase [Polyangiaceae bacterium]